MGHEPLAVYEGKLYDTSLPLWLSPGCWDRVRIRATVVRRDVYESVGGMPHEPEARVLHRDTATMGLMIVHVGDHVAGQCRFHDESQEQAVANRIPRSKLLVSRDFLHRRTVRRVAAAIRATLRHVDDASSCPALTSLCAKAGRAAWFGGLPQVLRTWLEVRLSYLRFLRASKDETDGLREVEVFWNAIRIATETRYYTEQAGPRAALGDGRQTEGTFSPANLTALCSTGFHTLEQTSDGRDIRWSSAVARVLLDIAPGHYHITLDTGGIRPDQREMTLAFFWNDQRIHADRVRHTSDAISFKVDRRAFHKTGPQELMMICEPMAGTADSRMLGLPVLGLRFHPRSTAAEKNIPAMPAALS